MLITKLSFFTFLFLIFDYAWLRVRFCLQFEWKDLQVFKLLIIVTLSQLEKVLQLQETTNLV